MEEKRPFPTQRILGYPVVSFRAAPHNKNSLLSGISFPNGYLCRKLYKISYREAVGSAGCLARFLYLFKFTRDIFLGADIMEMSCALSRYRHCSLISERVDK